MKTTPASMTNKAAAPGAAPLPAILHQLGEVLTKQVSLLIDMIMPGASRVYRPTVFLTDQETASTNGSLWIRMPVEFLGLNYVKKRVEAAPIWLGLLAHEFGHWLQPLDGMTAVEKELHVPHWLTNILLDIHGEALIAGLFPGLSTPLTASRDHVGRAMAAEYKSNLKKADSFLDALQTFALYFRFCALPSCSYGYSPSSRGPAPMGVPARTASRVRDCALSMGRVLDKSAEELPGFLRDLVADYPELILPPGDSTGGGDGDGKGAGEPAGGMESGGSSTSSGGNILPTLKRLIDKRLPAVSASEAGNISSMPREFVGPASGFRPPSGEAIRLACKLTIRFQTPKGALSVPAPGRLDRIAALHQDPMPFRLELPSRFSGRPSPKVVLHVDHSGSMGTDKWARARLAAQAIALAIRRVGGDVRVTLFEGNFHHAPDYSADVLFANNVAGLTMIHADGQDTSFAWLPIVWMEFPDHIHILLTDGAGLLPVLIPERARSRTFAIVIPDGSPDRIAPLAAKVVVVHDLSRLPGVFAFLAPRQWVG